MPYFRNQRILGDCYLGVWKVVEPLSYFEEKLTLFPAEKKHVKTLAERKKLEWYASRWTLHLLSGRKDRGACLYDQHGKPYLENADVEISMSHSEDMVAVMAGPTSIGIDVQKINPKIFRIKEKFLREDELEMVDDIFPLNHLHVLWGAKECLFKAYGKGQLAFKEGISIHPFFYKDLGGETTGEVHKDAYFRTFKIGYEKVGNYIMVFAKAEDDQS